MNTLGAHMRRMRDAHTRVGEMGYRPQGITWG